MAALPQQPNGTRLAQWLRGWGHFLERCAWCAPAAIVGLAFSCSGPVLQVCTEEQAGAIFAERIEPILHEDNPSCNQCHLSGVDLSVFVRDTQCETMACLTSLGLVDLESPTDSKVLGWIQRADPKSPLITKDVVEQEYQGFLEWIEFQSRCNAQLCAGAQCNDALGGECETEKEPLSADTEHPYDDGTCADVNIERVFRNTMYPFRERCAPCHFDTEEKATELAPRWISAKGGCNLASLETLRRVENLGLINVDNPSQSLLLLKPLAQSDGGVWHGGNDKFADKEDEAYKAFLYFLERYVECHEGTVVAQ